MNNLMRSTLAVVSVSVMLAACERPPVDTTQRGFRGTGMVEVDNPRTVQASMAANQVPEALPPVESGGPSAGTIYKNVQVLKDLNAGEFTRLMVAITNWVSPKEGCAYCHEGADFASEAPYTKIVARRMLEMTRDINGGWKNHVAETGVTCYTCHRGEPVPSQAWFKDPGPVHAKRAGNLAGQNTPAAQVGMTSLPFDPFSKFLLEREEIRAIPAQALPGGTGGKSIMQTEATYSLMMHMSQSLDVNCTYCHNSRSFSSWDGSSPQRTTAWHGIRMVRDLNANYIVPLTSEFPPNRLGPSGDVAKVNCATCHAGANKPFYGATMLKDHPELATRK